MPPTLMPVQVRTHGIVERLLPRSGRSKGEEEEGSEGRDPSSAAASISKVGASKEGGGVSVQ